MWGKMKQKIFVLGAAGYIGKTVVQQAVVAGWEVKALVRSAAGAAVITELGGQAVIGDVLIVESWLDEVRDCRYMVDLIQPKLPKRISRRSIQAAADYRLNVTSTVIGGIKQLAENDRPLFFNISGVDDLAVDADGFISHRSALVKQFKGFAQIGVPVRLLVESTGLNAIHVYLGTVYGPGKAFAQTVVPGLLRRKIPVIGSGENHMALIYVEDAARAIVHLCTQADNIPPGSTWVVTDGTATTQAELMDGIASMLKVKPPRHIPYWLAALLAGVVTSEVLTRECKTDISALQRLGFKLNYPTWQSGVPQMLKSLGYSI
jgi:nucleoside-diphosphate-sugar epimerase